jgi:chemotaxis response regulator CheB
MPGSAIRTGAVDYILPLEEIGPTILELTQQSQGQAEPSRNSEVSHDRSA